ncbi:MAG: [protein-PII] uridylyltransferase [Thermodesulfobacteriota bacterium]
MNMKSNEANILTRKREQLIKDFLAGRDAPLLEDLTTALDEYFYSVFADSVTAEKLNSAGNPFALVALGGYGRQEQCIHSDVDLLILFDKKVPPDAETFIQEAIYPLWDARFEVGYGVRTVPESIAMAFERYDILTTYLDARFICGASHIYSAFMERFLTKLNKPEYLKNTFERLIEHGEKRHSDFGDSTYRLEPNLKSGYGGLRDYHSILWYARIKSNIKNRRDLEYYGFLSNEEYTRLNRTLEMIWNIRNHLHYISGRKCDQLHFEYQVEMAELLGYRSDNGHSGVEIFMGELHSKMEFLKHVHLIVVEDILASSRLKKARIQDPNQVPEGLRIENRRLNFAGSVHVLKNPTLLFTIFLESGKTRIPLSIEAQRIVSEFSHLVDRDFRRQTSHIRMFEKILSLSLWEFNVLNVMLSTGILARFIPEFAAIVNKIQFNEYHQFPVDKHSIRCVQIVNDFRNKSGSAAGSLYARVYKDLRSKKLLLLAALLHDIGKESAARDHSTRGAEIAERILVRMGYGSSDIKDIAFLIRHHLFLIKTATRRDISDEETAVFCANRIKKVPRLRMLYLLSVADSKATGPKAWNDWTEALLKDLFLKTLSVMKRGELASRRAERLVEQKKAEILSLKEDHLEESELMKDLESMSRRYLLYMPAKDIMTHMNLYRTMGGRRFNWLVSRQGESEVRTVTICGPDRPGFYSKVAGVFFMNSLNILASEAYSWRENTALDIFKVEPPKDRIFEAEKWQKAEKDLENAMQDDSFLERLCDGIPAEMAITRGQRPEPNQVKIDNETSSFFTIIEVFTYDFPGLLFAVTNSLYKNGVDVKIAKVATKVDQVIDIFYVRSCDDEQKIESPERLETIKKSILQTLPEIVSKEASDEKN